MEQITIALPGPEEVEYSIESWVSSDPIEGNVDDSLVEELEKQLEYNPWAWCDVRVVAKWRGMEGDDYLGQCSYEDEGSFKKDGYYEDMKDRAYKELITNIKALGNGDTV